LTDYPGNYSDYARASSRAPAEIPPVKGDAASTLPTTKQERIAAREREKQRARGLERARKRLAALEEEILEREERIEELTAQLAEPDVYSDGDFVRATLAERDEVRATIDEHYVTWEGVAAEIESFEADRADASDES
jgi:hypothetical protein